MIQLLKFEFLRKRSIFLAALVLTIIGQLYVGYRFLKIDANIRGFYGEHIVLTYMGVLLLAFALLYFIDIVTLFKNDLFKQEGYMLFMTPNSGYKILGSKLVFALLEGIGIALVYVVILFANFSLLFNEASFFSLRGIEVDVATVFLVIRMSLLLIVGIVEFALTVYLSFALFKSLINNARFKGMITFVIFILISVLKANLLSFVGRIYDSNLLVSTHYASEFSAALNFGLVVSLVSATILFFSTGYLLENKINL